MLPEDVGVLLERLVRAHEDDAQLGELLLDRVVDDLAVVLGADAGQEAALGLRDAQPLEGVLDLVGHVVPGALLALRGLAVVDDLVEVDAVQAIGPERHGPLQEVLVGAQPVLQHPVRLVLEGADLLHRGTGQAALGLVEVDDVVVEGVLGTPVLDELAGVGHGSSWPVPGRGAWPGWRHAERFSRMGRAPITNTVADAWSILTPIIGINRRFRQRQAWRGAADRGCARRGRRRGPVRSVGMWASDALGMMIPASDPQRTAERRMGS